MDYTSHTHSPFGHPNIAGPPEVAPEAVALPEVTPIPEVPPQQSWPRPLTDADRARAIVPYRPVTISILPPQVDETETESTEPQAPKDPAPAVSYLSRSQFIEIAEEPPATIERVGEIFATRPEPVNEHLIAPRRFDAFDRPTYSGPEAVEPKKDDDGVFLAEIDDSENGDQPTDPINPADGLDFENDDDCAIDLNLSPTIEGPGASYEPQAFDEDELVTIEFDRPETPADDNEFETPDNVVILEVMEEEEPEVAEDEIEDIDEAIPDEVTFERVTIFPDPDPSLRPNTARIMALMNQKGGVGKTTSTVSIGAALAHMGLRVLLIDLDPQAHLTLHFGVEPDQLDNTVYNLIVNDDVSAEDVVVHVNDCISVLPAETNLAGAESELAPKLVTGTAQRVLRNKVMPLLSSNETSKGFDYVLIDCPPSLGLLTINALTLADEVIVPMQAHFLALQGLSKLFETINLIRQSFNPNLSVAGVVLCMHEGQTILAQEVMADLSGFLEGSRGEDVPWQTARVFEPPVRRNIKLAECPSFGVTIFDYAPNSNGAEDYRSLADGIAHQIVAS